jgi:hypothetical protein
MYLRWCNQEAAEGPGAMHEVAHHIYRNDEGRDVVAKVKWANKDRTHKDFTWLHKSGNRWMRGLKGVDGTVPLYRLDELLASEGVVYCVEGEKDADRLWDDGLIATSTKLVGRSASKIVEPLIGRMVVVIPDNDPDKTGAGLARRFAVTVAKAGAKEVRLMPPFGGEEPPKSGYDVSDWFNDGGTIGELEMMASTDALVEIIQPDQTVDSGDGASLDGTIDEVTEDRQPTVIDWAIENGMEIPPGITERDLIRSVAGRVGTDIATAWKMRGLAATEEGEVNLQSLIEGSGSDVPPPAILRQAEGRSMLYQGTLNMVFGYGGHGKSFFSMLAVADCMMQEKHAAYLTYELPPKIIVTRLMGMGVPLDTIYKYLHVYVRHVGSPAKVLDAHGGWKDEGLRLVVVDSTNKAIIAHGLRENDVSGFGRLNNDMLMPFTEQETAVLLIDHVTQNKETRDRPINSAEKFNAVQGVILKIEVVQEFSKTVSGFSKLELKKDNFGESGWTVDDNAGFLMVEANGHGLGKSKFWVQASKPEIDLSRLIEQNSRNQEASTDRENEKNKAILLEVSEADGTWGRSKLSEGLSAKYGQTDRTWRRAIDKLVKEGTLVEVDGKLSVPAQDREHEDMVS